MKAWWLTFAIALGCSSTKSEPAPAQDVDAGVTPIIDPSLFDCTSLARPPLARKAASTPECLRDPSCKGRFISGHRGVGGMLGRIAPEDTLSAYRAAIALGTDIVETDPRPTSDGIIVNLHDDTLDRTTDGTGKVDETTFAAIRALHVKTGTLAGDFACEKVPTLEELLTTSKGRALVLVDANKTDHVDALVAAIHAADAVDWAVFDTSSTDKIDQALALEPKLMIMPRAETADGLAPLLAKYKDHVPAFVEVTAIFPNGIDQVHAAGSRALTDAFVTDFGILNGQARSAYLDVFATGVDVVQTELPDEVLEALGRPVPPP